MKLDEGNRNMAAAAHMVDLRPLSGRALSQRTGTRYAQHRDMIDQARGGGLIYPLRVFVGVLRCTTRPRIWFIVNAR